MTIEERLDKLEAENAALRAEIEAKKSDKYMQKMLRWLYIGTAIFVVAVLVLVALGATEPYALVGLVASVVTSESFACAGIQKKKYATQIDMYAEDSDEMPIDLCDAKTKGQ